MHVSQPARRHRALPLPTILIGTTLAATLAVGAAEPPPVLTDASHLLAPFVRQGLGGAGEGVAGAAWLDFDNDGDLDLLVTNGVGHPNALFENAGGAFVDIAAAAGVASGLGHSGAAAADIDNDGCTDLFLTGEGTVIGIGDGDPSVTESRLYINNCDGTFSDITTGSGIPALSNGLSAAFGDIDNDGYLDLFIGRPNVLTVAKDHKNGLYLNNRDRTFTDITEVAGPGFAANLSACAVSFSDYDRDGWIDIFVANCADLDLPNFSPIPSPFQLLRNNGDLTFTDVAPAAGLVHPGFWMAVAIGDIDGDLDLDLFATNVGPGFFNAPHILYRNNGDGTYTDVAPAAGVADWEFGWGASFADFDNDGDRDLFYSGSIPVPLFGFLPLGIFGPGVASPGRLFQNDGSGQFSMVESFNQEFKFTSGVSVADFDANGFPDVAVVATAVPNHATGPLDGRSLLLATEANGNHWLSVRLLGTESNRGGVGARITLRRSGQVQEVYAGSSFLSTESPWPLFGLRHRRRETVDVAWPSGLVERFESVRADRIVDLVEGSGEELDDNDDDDD